MRDFEKPSDVSRKRIARWMAQAIPVQTRPTWIEKRLAIDVGEHTYIISNGQIFECGHCGHYDPEWNATEVLRYLEGMGNKAYEIEVECSVKIPTKKVN